MAKKTWIKVKRGLLEPKHIERLGVRFFLYLYYLDQADWVKGAVLFYRDRDASDELGIPITTIRKQRVKLENDGYVSCLQKKDHQIITIHNWTNPREYSGKIYNESNQKGAPSIKEVSEDNHKDDHKGNPTMGTPSSNSHITNHIKDVDKELNSAFETMHKTILTNTFNKTWWKIMEQAPKELDGKILKIFVNNPKMVEGVNSRSKGAQKKIAYCSLPFTSFMLVQDE